MKLRRFGKTGRMVTEIGLGTWQLGTRWGDKFNHEEAMKILEATYESGITLIDTADIYNKGNSEKAIGEFIKEHPDRFYIVTKCGKGLKEPAPLEIYNASTMEKFIDGSLERLGVERLDMVLLHCPPSPVFRDDKLFTGLEKLVAKGKIAGFGVSIEKISQGLDALEFNISAIEVIYNMFRLKPEEELFPRAKEKDVAILARVPLASGLLTGKYTADTRFGEKDHRTFNRNGESFDKGETFSGVDYATGLKAVEELKKLFDTDDLAPYALRWILMNDAVSTVIPGASRKEQILSNIRAAELGDLTDAQMKGVRAIYDKYIRASVHPNW